MKLKGLIISIACLSCSLAVFGQKSVSTAEYDFFINDTLRLDPSQIKFVDTLPTTIRRTLTPRPKTDGFTVYYTVDGRKVSEGELKNKQKEGLWYSYFDSGIMASKINYSNNKREGACWFYYKTAQLNAVGQFVNDLKEGEWTYYLKDGTVQGVYQYKAGALIEQR